MSTDPFLYVDDTYPDIAYSNDQWFDNSDVSARLNLPDAFNDTLSSTTTVGAAVRFSFTGASHARSRSVRVAYLDLPSRHAATQIAVVGATPALPGAKSDSGPISEYVIDGDQKNAFYYQADATNATGVVFFVSHPLSEGQHILDILVYDVSPVAPFYLDTILLRQPQALSGVKTVTQTWVTTVISTPAAASTTPTSLTGNVAGSESKLPTGAIVGGVVGGVALLVAAVLAFYFLYWRKRHYGYHGFSRDALFDAGPSAPHSSDVPVY